MKTKTNLEAEKLAANNQMDQDYWAEKGTKEEVEKELRDDIALAASNLEMAEMEASNSAYAYGIAKVDYVKAGEKLAKFLEQNPKEEFKSINTLKDTPPDTL